MSIPTIGFVIGGYETYGVSRFISSVVVRLVERGVRCEVFSLTQGSLTDTCLARGARVEVSELSQPPDFGAGGIQAIAAAWRLFLYTLRAKKEVATWLRRRGVPNVVVRMPNLVFLTGLAAGNAGASSFWIMPNAVSGRYPLHLNKVIYDIFFHFSKMVPIANSEFTRSTLLKARQKARVLHLGVEVAEFDPENTSAALRSSWGFKHDDKVYGVFARLVPEKGQAQVIRALASIRDVSVKIFIVGGPLEGKFYEELLAIVRQHGLEDRVVFAGPQSSVAPLYLLCDVVVNSRIDAEPFGLSIIEAMMMGRPVLAHALGGPGETVIDGQTGWLIDEPTVGAFANGIQRSLIEHSSWPRMGSGAREHALRHYSTEVVADKLLELMAAVPLSEKASCA